MRDLRMNQAGVIVPACLMLLCCSVIACGGVEGDEASQESELTSSSTTTTTFKAVSDSKLELFLTPTSTGHAPIVTAISKAKTSVKMAMYHLTDKQVVQALIDAQARGVAVQVILDGASLSQSTYSAAYKTLLAGHVDVVKSSSAFSITHEKAMVIDSKTAYLLTMNMTNTTTTTRDFGIVLHSSPAVKEWDAVFDADFQNAKNQTGTTPALTDAAMVWSPVNSEGRLVALINSAKTSLDVATESISDKAIIAALGAAVKRGVDVRLIVPECDQTLNPLMNYPALATLESAGVNAHVMPSPSTGAKPYMHAKMILVDGAITFLGSENLTSDSLNYAREAGVIFKNTKAAETISSTFETDWAASVPVPAKAPTCK